VYPLLTIPATTEIVSLVVTLLSIRASVASVRGKPVLLAAVDWIWEIPIAIGTIIVDIFGAVVSFWSTLSLTEGIKEAKSFWRAQSLYRSRKKDEETG
jgi:hypothetical protein